MIKDCTRIVVSGDMDEELGGPWIGTWADFARDNEDCPELVADIAAQLIAESLAVIGGGAMAEIVVKFA